MMEGQVEAAFVGVHCLGGLSGAGCGVNGPLLPLKTPRLRAVNGLM